MRSIRLERATNNTENSLVEEEKDHHSDCYTNSSKSNYVHHRSIYSSMELYRTYQPPKTTTVRELAQPSTAKKVTTSVEDQPAIAIWDWPPLSIQELGTFAIPIIVGL